jgi:hypothetical protein
MKKIAKPQTNIMYRHYFIMLITLGRQSRPLADSVRFAEDQSPGTAVKACVLIINCAMSPCSLDQLSGGNGVLQTRRNVVVAS